jgi:hypothetical protein
MATSRVPHDLFAWLAVGARAAFLSVCTVALVSCGGARSGPAVPLDSGGAVGTDTADGQSVVLNPPARVGESNRIEVAWQAQGDLTSFTVFVQLAAGLGFEAVDATVSSNSARFARGAAYRLDFPTARVLVRGCDASNQCVDSNTQPLLDVLLTGVAQVDPSIQPERAFGYKISLSADGNTLAAASSEGDPNQPGGGAVRIFQRGDDGRWVQETRLERFSMRGSFGPSLALSGDGQTLVVGAADDVSSVSGIGNSSTGAIHVFTRDARQRQWSVQAFIKAAIPMANGAFGKDVAVSHDGNRVLVAALNRMYLLEREAGQWRQVHIFEPRPGTQLDSFSGMALSANGSTVAVRAVWNAIPYQAVHVYKPCPCGDGWRLVADLRSAKSMTRPEDPPVIDAFGFALSLSGDGTKLAVGARLDFGDASDNGTTQNMGSSQSGAVYIFGADESGAWQRRAFLKARTAPVDDQLGAQVALSGDGKVLAAKACGLAANADGLRRNHRAGASIGSRAGDETCGYGGSSYVFEESPAGTWSHTAAAIPAPGELVSQPLFSLALSADAQTLGMGFSSISGLGSVTNGTIHHWVWIY